MRSLAWACRSSLAGRLYIRVLLCSTSRVQPFFVLDILPRFHSFLPFFYILLLPCLNIMGLNYPDALVSQPQVDLIMLSHPRHAPPVRPSRSLEGLEKVVPPGANYPATRTDLQLNKPLPAKPLVQTSDIPQSAWSDDSSVESFCDRTDSNDSTESYPIFVSSDSDDLESDIVDPDDPSDPLPAVEPLSTRTKQAPNPPALDPDISSSFGLKAFLCEERYGSNYNWAQSRIGTSHYFREKKLDFFPELATPSELHNSTSSSLPSAARTSKYPRKKDNPGRLNLSALGNHASTFAIGHGVRDSIRSYVHRTLSKGEKAKRQPHPRPVTAPSMYPYKTASISEHSLDQSASRDDSLDLSEQTASLSLSTNSSTHERHSDEPPTRRKQLAVPISPYQKYGASIWDKSGGTKRTSHRQGSGPHVRFPKYKTTKRSKRGTNKYSTSAPTLSSHFPLPQNQQQQSKDYVKALHGGTSHVRDALDDAKRKVIASKDHRRRERLKAQIKLVGPVSPNKTQGDNPWV